MDFRLQTVAPELVRELSGAADNQRRAAAIAASRLAIERTAQPDSSVDNALHSLNLGRTGEIPERLAVRALMEELDYAAWDLQELVDAGQAEQHECLLAFAKARAVAAVEAAFEENSLAAAANAAYEAQHAIQDLDLLRDTVLRVLASRP